MKDVPKWVGNRFVIRLEESNKGDKYVVNFIEFIFHILNKYFTDLLVKHSDNTTRFIWLRF